MELVDGVVDELGVVVDVVLGNAILEHIVDTISGNNGGLFTSCQLESQSQNRYTKNLFKH